MRKVLVSVRYIAALTVLLFAVQVTDCEAQRNATKRFEKEVFGKSRRSTPAKQSGESRAAAKAMKEQEKKMARRDREDAKALKEKGETPEELLRSIKENEAAVAEAERVVDAWKAIAGEKSRREEAAKAEAERIATEKAEAERKAAEERERAEKEEEARVEAERKERDENGQPFVVSSDGTTTFGEITEDTGLTAAPIKLSEGVADEMGNGYGLRHTRGKSIAYPSAEAACLHIRMYTSLMTGSNEVSVSPTKYLNSAVMLTEVAALTPVTRPVEALTVALDVSEELNTTE